MSMYCFLGVRPAARRHYLCPLLLAVVACQTDFLDDGCMQGALCTTATDQAAPSFLQVDVDLVKSSLCPESPVDLDMFGAEFGWETMAAVPYAYWLHHTCGKLASTQSCGHMSAWYWFSPRHTNNIGCHREVWLKLEPPNNNSFHGVGKLAVLSGATPANWEPPPHKEHYRLSTINWPRLHPKGLSIMILNNFRYMVRGRDGFPDFWLDAYDFPLLGQVLSAVQETCPDSNVLYHRDFFDEINMEEHDIDDGNVVKQTPLGEIVLELPAIPTPFPGNLTDWQWLQKYPFVSGTLGAFKQNKFPSNQYNAFLMSAMSHHNCFISVQGGLQASSAWFGGKHVILNSEPGSTLELDYNFYERGEPKFAGGEFTKVLQRSELLQTLKEKLLANACQACTLS
eukprot:TRINITY_DN1352_c0_g1_i1.p1 TRINITY_DN1352_c0_g1~~TRINITY_DN1352_c0_g1_i1.p1  ORF type:complete len:397 (+),score=38.70 TRINITY_DN1352_c0_g1_i1:129-1319(+)